MEVSERLVFKLLILAISLGGDYFLFKSIVDSSSFFNFIADLRNF